MDLIKQQQEMIKERDEFIEKINEEYQGLKAYNNTLLKYCIYAYLMLIVSCIGIIYLIAFTN